MQYLNDTMPSLVHSKIMVADMYMKNKVLFAMVAIVIPKKMHLDLHLSFHYS